MSRLGGFVKKDDIESQKRLRITNLETSTGKISALGKISMVTMVLETIAFGLHNYYYFDNKDISILGKMVGMYFFYWTMILCAAAIGYGIHGIFNYVQLEKLEKLEEMEEEKTL